MRARDSLNSRPHLFASEARRRLVFSADARRPSRVCELSVDAGVLDTRLGFSNFRPGFSCCPGSPVT